jgi:hypothetical protein
MPQLVHLPATRYVTAVYALRRSVRLWHRLDAALVGLPHLESELREVDETVRLLDATLDTLVALLGRSRRV